MIIIIIIDDTNQSLANFKGAGTRRGGRELTQVRPVWVGGNINWLARAVWVVGEGAMSLAVIRRLRVRPVWVGENVMAREDLARTSHLGGTCHNKGSESFT
ncbi:MAG: hypothetical protein ACKPKO_04670, partial [Candidatus Fonsibacter sp.]